MIGVFLISKSGFLQVTVVSQCHYNPYLQARIPTCQIDLGKGINKFPCHLFHFLYGMMLFERFCVYQKIFDLLRGYLQLRAIVPVGIYLLKVNDRNTRTRCEICSKLTIKTPVRRQWRLSGAFIINSEHISHLALVFLSLTLSR